MENKIIPIFNGEVKNGKLELDNPTNFNSYVANLEGKVQLSIKKFRKTRSENQNALYWVYLRLICDETGEEDIMNAHDFFKLKFLPKRITFNGEEIFTSESTASLDKASFGEYLTKIERLTGIPIPAPDTFEQGLR